MHVYKRLYTLTVKTGYLWGFTGNWRGRLSINKKREKLSFQQLLPTVENGFEVQAAHQHRYASTVIFQGLAEEWRKPLGLLLGKLMGLHSHFGRVPR